MAKTKNDNFNHWLDTFIEKEISYYRETYTSIETRAGFFSTFASGLAALLVLWVRVDFFGQAPSKIENFLFITTLVLLVFVVLFSVSALRPRSGNSSMFGLLFWERDIIEFKRASREITKTMKEIEHSNFSSVDEKIKRLEEAWLIAEPKSRTISFYDINDNAYRKKAVSSRMTMLVSFRRHVQLKAFFILAAIYTMMLSVITFFSLILVSYFGY